MKKAVIGSVMAVAVIIVFSPLYISNMVSGNSSEIETIASISQIVANFFVIFGVIVALWQYIIYSNRELDQKEKELFDMDKARIQKAIDLSGYFKDEIIKNFEVILFVYRASGITDILYSLPAKELKRFDKLELESKLDSKKIAFIKNAASTKKFRDALAEYCSVNQEWSNCIEYSSASENGNTKTLLIKGSIVRYKFNNLLNDLLNSLEFFSMHFTHQTADETVVYQPLHDAFIQIVRTLYFDICSNNNGLAEQKVFTKTIELYHMWQTHASEQYESEYAATDEKIFKGKKLKVK